METKKCCFPGSLCLVDSTLFYSIVLKGGESSSPHGLVVVEGSIFFSDTKARQIKVLNHHTDSGEAEVNVFAGNGVAQRKYGLANVAAHLVNQAGSSLKVTHSLSATLVQTLFPS